MATKTITAENVSQELLQSILADADVPLRVLDDGDLFATDLKARIHLQRKAVGAISIIWDYRLRPTARPPAVLEAIDRVHREYLFLRLFAIPLAPDVHVLRVVYDISIVGGIAPKHLVGILPRLQKVKNDALTEHLASMLV